MPYFVTRGVINALTGGDSKRLDPLSKMVSDGITGNSSRNSSQDDWDKDVRMPRSDKESEDKRKRRY